MDLFAGVLRATTDIPFLFDELFVPATVLAGSPQTGLLLVNCILSSLDAAPLLPINGLRHARVERQLVHGVALAMAH